MHFEVIFLLLFGFSYAAPHVGLPLLGPGGGGIFKGPDSETIIRGPDGSEITSEQVGGIVVKEDGLAEQPIIVAEPEISALGPIVASTAAPILAPVVASAAPPLLAPVVASAAPPLLAPISVAAAAPTLVSAAVDVKPIEIVQQDPHIIETEIIEAPDVEPEQSSDLEGPSGRIITKGSASVVSGPASTTITEPRKIIIAPPKFATPLQETSYVTSLSSIAPSTLASLPAVAAPPTLISSTEIPLNLAHSTAAPLSGLSSTIDSRSIDLGIDHAAGAPLVEYSSSNGVISGGLGGLVSSTPGPLISSTIVPLPAADLVAPAAPIALAPSANIQRIPKIANSIAADGRIGELLQNEISDLSQTEYLGPALAQGGIDAAQINLAQVPLSQVSKIGDGAYSYETGLGGGVGWDNRYKRDNFDQGKK
ncbi:calphotin-like isoform X2 [Euwallacea fornicatus]|uniref:calphotin-like isoform X2 n=1 Tax=Euwallacea fornicatus TaxID=995702 RepID=UPI00338E402C